MAKRQATLTSLRLVTVLRKGRHRLMLLLAVFLRNADVLLPHYSLMATSAVSAELKQFKVICPGNRQTYRQSHRQTTVTLAMHPHTGG